MKSVFAGMIASLAFIFVAHGVVYGFDFADLLYRSSTAVIGATVYALPMVGFPVKYEWGMLSIIIIGIVIGMAVKWEFEWLVVDKSEWSDRCC